ncbi:Aste57867_15226 [Aphanomyces stellatus]|uniref:Aste57867_15226 protein n=1 Tax=Aphanomyces stellatus TaxID=120398 RepID=A0A485L2N1_9STRA|nr:hypothetical protein As57867_015170 [Aphanomyces stellatus]VFT92035.1 Aste57867_15226 [Aphanomyces stellatus]
MLQPAILLCVGDSNTELTSDPDSLGWQVRFTKDYVRRADVINRGAEGWNTAMWIAHLPTLLAEWASKAPSLVLLILGTNDASPTHLHIPLPDYQTDLETLVRGMQAAWGGTRVLLATPLPVDNAVSDWKTSSFNQDAGMYAAAMLDVATHLHVPALDLWTPLQPIRTTIFVDGLHLNRDGNVLVYGMLRDKIAADFPDLTPRNVTRVRRYLTRGSRVAECVTLAAFPPRHNNRLFHGGGAPRLRRLRRQCRTEFQNLKNILRCDGHVECWSIPPGHHSGAFPTTTYHPTIHIKPTTMFKFCPECGVKSSTSGSKFCAECGFRFEQAAVSVPPPPPPPSDPYPVAAPRAASFSNPAPPPPPVQVPPAATGADAQTIYAQCMDTIRAARGGNNEAGVKTFKANCKAYGLGEMDAATFHASLVADIGAEATSVLVPNLVRLIPDEEKRRALLEYDGAAIRALAIDMRRVSVGSDDTDSSRGSMTAYNANSMTNPQQSRGFLSGRYADHPHCDICRASFDLYKRRHQCRFCGLYVCSACSPMKLLIPSGQEIDGCKGYNESEPQRVCIQCAPRLHPLQDELVAKHGSFQKEQVHQTASRIQVPYSANLEKECCKAADIVTNFFRDDWGAAKDRGIPASFLEKAHGLAIMSIAKAGFIVSAQAGTGLVIAKLPDGSWSAPSAIGTVGISGGFEIGGELVEVMIILGSANAVKVFHKSQVNVGAGLDLTVGPYGRAAQAAAAVSGSGLGANYAYSQSKGFYAGISLTGTVIAVRKEVNLKFYGRALDAANILSGDVEQPNAAKPLYEAVHQAMEGVKAHRLETARRVEAMGACRSCGCGTFVPHTTQVWNKNCKTCKHIH